MAFQAADTVEVASPPEPASSSLTHNLTRNTLFNVGGWAWPIGLSLVAVPYTVHKLGTDNYGVFALISILAGYLGLLNGPVSMGNVRFMAEAYGRQDWDGLRAAFITGTVVIGALAAVAAVAMFLGSGPLARNVFKVPGPLVGSAIIAFRIAALSFYINAIAAALSGIPAAMRRYDAFNVVSVSVGTFNTVAVVLALWLGWGLLGAVMAALLSSVLAAAAYGGVAYRALGGIATTGQSAWLDRVLLRRLISFSALLFGGQIGSQIGLQLDRTLIGVLLGTSAVTYYAIPTKVTDQLPSFMYRFTIALYPLAAESIATNRLDELRRLYLTMMRILFWGSALLATLFIVLSRDFLTLWVGPELASHSYIVLIVLAAAVVWRVPGSLAYQVCTGLGKGGVNLVVAWLAAICLVIPVSILALLYGATGAALGVFIGLLPPNIGYDLYTQRQLLGQRSIKRSLAPYLRILLTMVGTWLCSRVFMLGHVTWSLFLLRACLTGITYLILGVVFGALQLGDIRFAIKQVQTFWRRMPS